MLVAILLFGVFFYYYCGFHYGVGNNVEELPLIFKIAGFAQFENDPFVTQSLSQFNASTLYVYFFGLAGRLIGIEGLPYLFFATHFFTFLLICFSIVGMLRQLKITSAYSMLGVLLFLLVISNRLYLIPNQRTLFINHLDPEFLAVGLLLAAIKYFIEDRNRRAAILLFFCTLVHPLYAIPIGATFIIISFVLYRLGDFRKLKTVIFYSLAVLSYSLLLWYLSRPPTELAYDAGLIHEIVRAPHHLVIPSWGSGVIKLYLRFLGSSFLLLLITLCLWKQYKNLDRGWSNLWKEKLQTVYKNGLDSLDKIRLILLLLLTYIGLASLVASFIRIPILVQLTPYRIGLFIMVLIVLVLSFYLNQFIKSRPSFSTGFRLIYVAFILSVIVLFEYTDRQKTTATTIDDREQVIDWINSNTSANTLFLNYSDIDVRTNCLRSDFFKLKTIPLTSSGQVDWYKRLLVYYSVPSEVSGKGYQNIAKIIENRDRIIDFSSVLKNTAEIKPDYLLLNHNNPINGFRGCSLVFENAFYMVYSIN